MEDEPIAPPRPSVPDEQRYFEDYLQFTGWGLYYKFLLGMACVCNLTRGLIFATMAFTVALSGCGGTKISLDNAVLVFIFYYTGCSSGALLSGALCDRYGRKRFLTYSLLSMFFGSFMAAFAYNNVVVLMAVVLLGIGLESNSLQMKLILVEILGAKHRGLCVLFCDLFLTIGMVLTFVSVILLETPTFFVIDRTAKVSTWRIMFAVCGCLSIVLACVCSLVEETPRYFLYLGRQYLAHLLLKQLYGINKSSYAENFPVREDELKGLISSYDLTYPEPRPHWRSLTKFLKRFWRSLKIIFSRKYFCTTCMLLVLKIVIIAPGTYDFSNIFAKIATYKELNNTLASTTRVFQILDGIYPAYTMDDKGFNATTSICDENAYHAAFYRNFLSIFVPGCLIGQVLQMLVVDWVKRKRQLAATYLIPTICFLFVRFVDNRTYSIVANSFIIATLSALYPMSALINLEFYPTAIRGTSYGVTSFASYLIMALISNWFDYTENIGHICYAAMFFCLFLSSWTVPELARKPLTE